MYFTTDQQTLNDLTIFGKSGSDSIFAIFNHSATRGGECILEEMFRYPLRDPHAIDRRITLIRYFASAQVVFPFQNDLFDQSEQYLANTDERTRLSEKENRMGKKLSHLVGEDTEYKTIRKGIEALIEILQRLKVFVDTLPPLSDHPWCGEREEILRLLAETTLMPVLEDHIKTRLTHAKMAAYDKILRFRQRETVKKILRHIYMLDVYISVAEVATRRNLVFPTVLPGERHTLVLEGVYHPQLKDPVVNTLRIEPDSSLVFLTGANMAGKSTFMKTLGIALFLAHMGFPVPAEKMEFSALDGIYTTINLPDNLGMGASHFYAEVLRIKKIAKELGAGKNLFVIFDELFRGTNVKDAHEATIAVATAFARKRNSLFIISTHIMEAGEVLRERCANIIFQYLPTRMDGGKPVYTHKLERGITADRHGMIIIQNEGILDLLKSTKTKNISYELYSR